MSTTTLDEARIKSKNKRDDATRAKNRSERASAIGWKPAYNPWLIAVVVTMATFMEVLDTSIANVALPHIAGNLSAGQDESTWILTSYLVSNAIVLPISGWISTVIGRKRFYMTCVALFTISSFLCGFAPSLSWLIFFRVLQGMGGGGLAPSEQAILTDTFPPSKRGMASAVYGIGVVVAPAVGPTLGGWITENYSWRWIFFINIPVGIISLLLTARVVEDPPFLIAERAKKLREGLKVDYIGFGLVALGLALLQVVLDKGEREEWFDSTYITVFTVIAVVSLVIFIIREFRHPDPVVDLPLLKERNFLMSNVMMFALGFVLFGGVVLLPLYLQTLMGYTATDAGLVITPGGFAVMALMPIVGVLVSKVEARWLIAFGFVISALALFHLAHINNQISYADAAWARIYQACGLAFLFVPINTAAYAKLPKNKSSNASAILNVSRNLGGSFGISFVTTMLARRTQFHQSVLAANVSSFDPRLAERIQNLGQMFMKQGANISQATRQAQGLIYANVQRQAAVLAFLDCFWLLGIGCLVVLPLVLLMKSNKPGAGGAAGH